MKAAAMTIRAADQSEFPHLIKVIESSYGPHDPNHAMPGRHPIDLKAPPWSWWSDPVLSWFVAEENGVLAGFGLWRRVGRNSHLHSFFVGAEFQGKGVAQELLKFHWAQSIQINPVLDTFTLHVREEAAWARRFYAKNSYRELDQKSLDPLEDSGLGDWIRNCRRFQWPLPPGQVLMARSR